MLIPSDTLVFGGLIVGAVVATVVLARRGRSMRWSQRLAVIGLAVYLPFVVGLTLGGIPIGRGDIGDTDWRTWANLVPLRTIRQQLSAGLYSGMRQLVGNLLLLFPLGFLLPMASSRFATFRRTFLTVFLGSLGIELGQLAISLAVSFPYRAFDVDDLIVNTLGGAMGWLVWRGTLGLHRTEAP